MGTPPSSGRRVRIGKGAADYPEISGAVNQACAAVARKFTQLPTTVVFLRA